MTNDYGNLELHMVLLDAMKDIDRICRENGLRYYLHAGTLLGAINHKGFIPWDDDVDISMMRADYEKFLEIVQKEWTHKYYVHNYKTDPNYKNNRTVLRVLGTEVIHFHENEDEVYRQIAVDIVPLDAVPNSKVIQKLQQGLVWVLDCAVQIKQGGIQTEADRSRWCSAGFTQPGTAKDRFVYQPIDSVPPTAWHITKADSDN